MPPKGWRKAGDTPVKSEEVEVKEQPVVVPDVTVTQPVALSPIEESRKSLEHPLQVGQAFFEAPDGYIIVGDEKQDRVFYRAGNGGKGYWINKRRI